MKRIISICLVLMSSSGFASTADICYAKQTTRVLWQKMQKPLPIGSKCIIYNATYTPVYEGVVGKCIHGVSCDSVPLNVDLGKRV